MSGKIVRNDPFSCGSGKKYKKCCLHKDEERKALKAEHNRQVNEDFDDEYETEKYWDDEKKEEQEDYCDEANDELEEKALLKLENKFKSKKFKEKIPKISVEEESLVMSWWDKYKLLTKKRDDNCKNIKDYIVDFLEEYPKLAINLYLHEEAIFELETSYMRNTKADYNEFIEFLKWFRNNFYKAYELSAPYYDYYIITHCLVNKNEDEVEKYFTFFKDYPDSYPDELYEIINVLIVAGCDELIVKLLKDIYPNIYFSRNIIKANSIVHPYFVGVYSKFLNKDYKDSDIEKLLLEIKEVNKNIPDLMCVEKEYWKNIIDDMFADKISFQDKTDIKDIRKELSDMIMTFAVFLKEKKQKSWINAISTSENVIDFLFTINKKRNPSKRSFKFNQKQLESYIIKNYTNLFSIDSIRSLNFLTSLYYFMDYAYMKNFISDSDIEKQKRIIADRYNFIIEEYNTIRYGVRLFKKITLDSNFLSDKVYNSEENV